MNTRLLALAACLTLGCFSVRGELLSSPMNASPPLPRANIDAHASEIDLEIREGCMADASLLRHEVAQWLQRGLDGKLGAAGGEPASARFRLRGIVHGNPTDSCGGGKMIIDTLICLAVRPEAEATRVQLELELQIGRRRWVGTGASSYPGGHCRLRMRAFAAAHGRHEPDHRPCCKLVNATELEGRCADGSPASRWSRPSRRALSRAGTGSA